jgi:hypothetical protein
MKRFFILTIIFSIFLNSCEYITARFRDYYDIKTIYKTDNENNNISNLVNIFQEISESPGAEYEHIGKKTYQKYSVPYTLQIIFRFYEDNNINEIIFSSCSIIIDDNEIDLLKLEEINVSPARYFKKTNSSSMGGRNINENKLFQEEQKLIIDESEDIFIQGYYINFRNLPIDTSIKTCSIEYNINIILNNGNIIETKNKATYSQEIIEKHLYSPIWNRSEN